MSEIKRFGPMHGERTRRHQFVATDEGLHRWEEGTIVSVYERSDASRLQVELMGGGFSGCLTSVALNQQEATWLRDAINEWLVSEGVTDD